MSAEPQEPMQRFEAVTGGIDDCNAGRVYQGPERRVDWHSPGTCVNMRIVEQRFADGTERMNRIEEELKANTAATTEIRDILTLGKSFFRLADLFGRLVKWIAAVAVPIIGIWVAIKTGGDKLP